MGLHSVVCNSLNKDIGNLKNKPSEKIPITFKKKRNPTEINFDFLDKENIEEDDYSEEIQVIIIIIRITK